MVINQRLATRMRGLQGCHGIAVRQPAAGQVDKAI
jgi:hypothetical protein